MRRVKLVIAGLAVLTLALVAATVTWAASGWSVPIWSLTLAILVDCFFAWLGGCAVDRWYVLS